MGKHITIAEILITLKANPGATLMEMAFHRIALFLHADNITNISKMKAEWISNPFRICYSWKHFIKYKDNTSLMEFQTEQIEVFYFTIFLLYNMQHLVYLRQSFYYFRMQPSFYLRFFFFWLHLIYFRIR